LKYEDNYDITLQATDLLSLSDAKLLDVTVGVKALERK